LSEAVRLKPQEAIYLNNRGATLFDTGKPLDDFNKAIALRPEWSTTHYNRADALEKLNRAAGSQKEKTAAKSLFKKKHD
jgi:Tfp pilus assembly protein PilF